MKFVWQWCEFGQVFNGRLGHLYKLGDWKTAESYQVVSTVASGIIGHRVTESQTPMGTQNTGG